MLKRRRKVKKKRNNIKLYIPLMILSFLLIVSAVFYFQVIDREEPNKSKLSSTTKKKVSNEDVQDKADDESSVKIRIAAAGDIMFHDDQLASAYDEVTDTYDFTPMFQDVRDVFQNADFAIANFETTTAGSEQPFVGYPRFNSPDEAVDAIINAHIDAVTTANNHSLDTGKDGLLRTVRLLREKQLPSVGTYDDQSGSRILMKNVNGIDIAVIAYTESTNGLGKEYPEDQLNDMLNLMTKENIKRDIEEAKKQDADLIIAFMHWGEEYSQEPNVTQIDFANYLVEEGVDIILGSHPHVIQRSDFIEKDDNKAFVIYSLGNFISNQRKETLGDEFESTEDGVIVNFTVEKNLTTGETYIVDVDYIPTWVYRKKRSQDDLYDYRILPIEQFIEDYNIPEDFKKRMQRSQEATMEKMDTVNVEDVFGGFRDY